MAEPDLLFTVRNNFYLGAFQSAIAEASDLEGLSDAERIERDCFVYRSYIELGSFEVGPALPWSIIVPKTHFTSFKTSGMPRITSAACDF